MAGSTTSARNPLGSPARADLPTTKGRGFHDQGHNTFACDGSGAAERGSRRRHTAGWRRFDRNALRHAFAAAAWAGDFHVRAQVGQLCRQHLRAGCAHLVQAHGSAIRDRGRRQHPAGPYVLDFFCTTANLAIEVSRNSTLAEQASEYFDNLWSNRAGIGIEYTTDFAAYADPAQSRYWLYRLMEGTGLSTF